MLVHKIILLKISVLVTPMSTILYSLHERKLNRLKYIVRDILKNVSLSIKKIEILLYNTQ